MKRIVWDEPARVMRFVADAIGEKEFHGYTAIGLERDGAIVGGVVYDRYSGADVMTHIASDGTRRWMTGMYLAAIFAYPFLTLKCRRITALVRVDNSDSQHFCESLGFSREGLLREGMDDGTDLIVYGMLARECRFLEEKYHG